MQIRLIPFVLLGLLFSGCYSPAERPLPGLRLAVSQAVSSLDPAQVDDLYSAEEVAKVYEGLFQYHYLKRPYELIPGLAAAMPEVSADGKTYLFKIKKGIFFADDPCFEKTQGKGRELL